MLLINSSFWEVKKFKNKGHGILLTHDIAAGTVIGDYLGKIIYPSDVVGSENEYDLWCDEKFSILPNLKDVGVHTINHSCAPNCAMITYASHTLYFALRKIFKGEELSVSYNLGLPDFEDTPCRHFCACGTLVCRGTFHNNEAVSDRIDAFEKKREGKNYGKLPALYGSYLKPLAIYPKKINDYPVFDLFATRTKSPHIYRDLKLPDITTLRQRIRETGKQLKFVSINILVYGIMNNALVAFFSK